MPARRVQLTRSMKKKPSPVSRLLPYAKPLSFKKPSSPVKNDEIKSLIKTMKAQKNKYNKMLNSEIKKAESKAKAKAKAKATRGDFARPEYFANIARMAFNNARKNNNGNVIMRNASPIGSGRNKRR